MLKFLSGYDFNQRRGSRQVLSLMSCKTAVNRKNYSCDKR